MIHSVALLIFSASEPYFFIFSVIHIPKLRSSPIIAPVVTHSFISKTEKRNFLPKIK